MIVVIVDKEVESVGDACCLDVSVERNIQMIPCHVWWMAAQSIGLHSPCWFHGVSLAVIWFCTHCCTLTGVLQEVRFKYGVLG